MFLKTQQFVAIITFVLFLSCREQASNLSKIEGKQLPITEMVKPSSEIETFVSPYRERINEVLDSTLAYAPKDLVKDDGKHNTTAGNLLADIIFEQARPIFESRTGDTLDFVVMNHGGIRSILSKGNVTARNAYEIMPFENDIFVVGMQGKAVRELVDFLIRANRPHPIAGLQIILENSGALHSITIQGRPFDENRTYYVATSDYLVQGGDQMGFFKTGSSITDIDYSIRNAMIDYFKKKDTIVSTVDDRFIQLN